MLQAPFRYTNWYRPLEKKYLERYLVQHFGNSLLLMGNTDLAQVESSPVDHHFALREYSRLGFDGVIADFNELPFEPDSLDLMVLAHALDHCKEPATVVKEVFKTLRHDGTLIITGFNCWRSLAKALWRHESRQYSSAGELLGVSVVRDLLVRQGFEILRVKRFGAISSDWGSRSFADKVLLRCAPCLCTGYVLVARKQGIRLQPVKLKMKEAVSPVKEVAPGSFLKKVLHDD